MENSPVGATGVTTPPTEPIKPHIEKGERFKPVTSEELDFLHDFARIPSSDNLTPPKNKNPDDGKRYEDVDARRVEELRKLSPPELSSRHQAGYSETEIRRAGGYEQVSFQEMNNRLQEMRGWMSEWNGLSPEQKLTHYNRMQELQRIKNIPTETIPKEQYETNIAQMEKQEENIIQDVEKRVESLNSAEFDQLNKLFDGTSTSKEVAERWSSLKDRDIDGYSRLLKIFDRFQKELEVKEPPFATRPSSVHDLKPVLVSDMSADEIEKIDLPALQGLLQRSLDFQKRWGTLSHEEQIEQYKRVSKLKGVMGMAQQEEDYVRRYLKEGEAIEGKAVEFWTNGIGRQLKNLQEAITAKEAQKQQEEVGSTKTALEEVAHEQKATTQETPPTPPPTKVLSKFFSGLFGGKK